MDKKHNNKTSKEKSMQNNNLLIILLVLVVLNIVLTLGMLFTSGGSDSSKLNEISTKVNAIDSFFSENIPEYNSGNSNGESNQGSNDYGNSNPDNLEVDIENEPFKGDENAPVTIVEFSDYECPFCGRFYEQTLPYIQQDYIDTGKVKLVYKDFPLGFHQMAEPAAIAANCVYNELGNEAYFKMHDMMFENPQSLTQKNFDKWAMEIGVTQETYEACKTNPQSRAEVQEDLAEGSRLGVSGTPSFIINGELVVGAQPYSVIKEVIERKLNE